jgi:hypothetical protein
VYDGRTGKLIEIEEATKIGSASGSLHRGSL